MAICYGSGEVIHAGDLLGPGKEWDGQAARVVVVIPSQEAVAGYEASAWAYLESGVMVEHVNARGIHLVHYPHIDEDFELLSRAP